MLKKHVFFRKLLFFVDHFWNLWIFTTNRRTQIQKLHIPFHKTKLKNPKSHLVNVIQKWFFHVFWVLWVHILVQKRVFEKWINSFYEGTLHYFHFFSKKQFFKKVCVFWIVLSICEGRLRFNLCKNSDFWTFSVDSRNHWIRRAVQIWTVLWRGVLRSLHMLSQPWFHSFLL